MNHQFKSQLTQEQRMAMKVNKEFDKRKERLSNSNVNYKTKVKSIPDFEIEKYDCGDPLEILLKKMTHVSYNVLQMCTELYNGTPGNILKERIIKIVSKLLLEYGDHSKELTDQMDDMMREISRFGIDTKLAPDFLTTMLNVINIIHQK